MAKVYCYYRPASSSGASSSPSAGGYLMNFGHFLIEVEKGHKRAAFDYYLGGDKSVVKKSVDENRRRKHLYISFNISEREADGMINKINSWARQPPEYEFPFGSTCVSRSNEILGMAKLGINDAYTPKGIWSGLLRKSLSDPSIWRDRGDQRLEFPHPAIPPRHGVPFPPLAPDAGLPAPGDYQGTRTALGLESHRHSLRPETGRVRITPQEIGIVRPYKVKANDRIWNLTDNSGYTDRRQFTNDVLRANPGLDPRKLRVGQKIQLPFKTQLGGKTQAVGSTKPSLPDREVSPGLTNTYTFQRGETVWGKAPEYGYSNPRQFVNDFKNKNPGVNPARVFEGKTYNMPFKGRLGAQTKITLSQRPGSLDVGGSLNLKTRYTFQRGETVWGKAPEYGYSNPRQFVNDFKNKNPGVNPARVFEGKTYNMPFKGPSGGRVGSSGYLRPQPISPQSGSLQWIGQGLGSR